MSNDDTPAKDAFGSNNDDDAEIDTSVLNNDTARTVDVENARPRTTETGVDLTVVARSLTVDVYDIDEYVTTFDDLRWEDAGDTVNVYAVVTRVDNDETVILSDETASVAFEIPSNLDFAELEAGDEVLLENVEVCASSRRAKLRAGIDTEVTDIDDDEDEFEGVAVDDRPVEEQLDERSDLVNAPSWYANSEKEQARRRVVKSIVDDHEIMHVMSTGETWLWFGETAWVPEGDKRIKSILNDHLPADVNERRERNEIVEQVQLTVQTDENPFSAGPPDDTDLKWCVPVKNGLVDLRESPGDALTPHDPGHYTTQAEVLDVEWDPEAEATKIDAELDKIASSDAMKRTIEEMMANMLFRNNDFRRAYVKVGPDNSAKSFTDMCMKWLIGDDGIEHMDFVKFVTDDFEGDASRNSYACIDDDASSNQISKSQCSAFKRYLGLGGVRTGAKNVKRESHDPYATIIFNVNDPPVWVAWGGSIKSRLMPIFFDQRFEWNPDPENDDEHQRKKSTELEKELRTDEELSGLLNQLIVAANRLYETEEWSIYEEYEADDASDAHDDLLRKYNNYADATERFWRKFAVQTDADDPVRIRKDDWHTIYRRMMAEEGQDPQPPSKFWEQTRDSDTIYMDFTNPYQKKRVTEYVRPAKKALDYAPKPVADRIRDKIDEIDVNPTDDVTRAENAGMGPVALMEGRVVSRKVTGEEVKIRIDDGTGRVDVVEKTWGEFDPDVVGESDFELDGVFVGDEIRVDNGTMVRAETGAPQLLVDEVGSVKVVDPGPNGVESRTGDDAQEPVKGSDDEADDVVNGEDDEAAAQQERVDTLKNTIEAEAISDDVDGARVDDVVDRVAEKLDVDEDTIRSDYESLEHQGVVYEVAEGRVRTV